MKTFKQFLKQKLQNEQMDIPPEPPAIVKPAIQPNKAIEKKDYVNQAIQKAKKLPPQQQIPFVNAVKILSFQRGVTDKDFQEFCDILFELTDNKKIKLIASSQPEQYGFGISFQWFDQERQQWITTREKDDFFDLRTLVNKLFPTPESREKSTSGLNFGNYMPSQVQPKN